MENIDQRAVLHRVGIEPTRDDTPEMICRYYFVRLPSVTRK